MRTKTPYRITIIAQHIPNKTMNLKRFFWWASYLSFCILLNFINITSKSALTTCKIGQMLVFIISYFMRKLVIIVLSCILLLVDPVKAGARVCPNSYFFDAQHCQKCALNCICTSEGSCDSCIQGYTMFRGSCIQCPQSSGLYGTCSGCCSRTSGTILSCTDCESVVNYYSFLFSGRCILSAGCFQVDANGYCLYCRSGYYSFNNQCYACHSSCKTCADSDNCLACAAGYYWKVADYGRCTACPVGCATCTNDQICTSCLNRYYFYTDHCLDCPTGCQVCVDGSTCTQCSTGILVSNLCINCTDSTYGGSAGCLQCYESNNFVKCSSCSDTYFLDTTNGVCRDCATYIPGAARCRDEKTPTQCQNDYDSTLTNRYYLIGISCVRNQNSCKKIADINGNCLSCYPNYIMASGQCQLCAFTGCVAANASVVANVCTCAVCSRGYYLTGVTCTACSTANCAICPANTCSACMQGYYFSGGSCLVATAANCLQSKSGSATLCAVCVDGYFLGSDQLCYRCQQNCLLCSSRLVCTKCQASTQLLNNLCVSYPTNCAEVQVSGSRLTCTLCNYGYFLTSGACVPCSVQLGTLGLCDGYCPIDYYIQSLMVQVVTFEIVPKFAVLWAATLIALFIHA